MKVYSSLKVQAVNKTKAMLLGILVNRSIGRNTQVRRARKIGPIEFGEGKRRLYEDEKKGEETDSGGKVRGHDV